MKKLLLSFAAVCVALSGFSQTKTEKRNVSDFTGIDASSVFNITVTKGNSESLTVEADEKIMEYVRSEVKNGVLRLYLDNDKAVKNVKILNAHIVMKNLEKVRLSGACKLSSNDLFTPTTFSGGLSGATNLSVNLQTSELDFGISGASNVNVNAKVSGNAKFDLSGSSKIALELTAAQTTFDISGASKIAISGKSDAANFRMSGASNVKASDFEAKDVVVRSSGASNVELFVTSSLKTQLSGAAKVRYKGRPAHIDVDNSGASSVKSME